MYLHSEAERGDRCPGYMSITEVLETSNAGYTPGQESMCSMMEGTLGGSLFRHVVITADYTRAGAAFEPLR